MAAQGPGRAVRIEETTLPGVGVRYSFLTTDGERVSVLHHHGGHRGGGAARR